MSKALEAARQAIRYLSHPETPWSDEQVQAVISAYISALPGEAEVEIVAWAETETMDLLPKHKTVFADPVDVVRAGKDKFTALIPYPLFQAMQARAEAAERGYEKVLNSYADENQRLFDRAEVAEEALRVSELEGDAAFALAVDDPGKNPPVTWKSRAEAAEARVKEMEEALGQIDEMLPNPKLPLTHAIKDITTTALKGGSND